MIKNFKYFLNKMNEGLNNLFKENDIVIVKGDAYFFKFDKNGYFLKTANFDFDEFQINPYLFKKKANTEGIYMGPSKFKTKNEILYIVAVNIMNPNQYDIYLTVLDNIWMKNGKEFARRGMEQAILIDKTKGINPYQEENWEN